MTLRMPEYSPIINQILEYLLKHRTKLAVMLLAMFVPLGFFFHRMGFLTVDSVINTTVSYPTIAPLVFVLAYGAMVVLFMPTLPMNLAAGFLWGPYVGGIYAIVGSSLGAAVAFAITRMIAPGSFSAVFQNRLWIWLDTRVRMNSWKALAFTRINPAFPFFLVNYFFGMTKIRFQVYFLGTILFITPGAVLFSAVGKSIRGVTLDVSKSAELQNAVILSSVLTAVAIVYWGIPILWNELRTKRVKTDPDKQVVEKVDGLGLEK